MCLHPGLYPCTIKMLPPLLYCLLLSFLTQKLMSAQPSFRPLQYCRYLNLCLHQTLCSSFAERKIKVFNYLPTGTLLNTERSLDCRLNIPDIAVDYSQHTFKYSYVVVVFNEITRF